MYSKNVHKKYENIAKQVRESDTGYIPWTVAYENIQRIMYWGDLNESRNNKKPIS